MNATFTQRVNKSPARDAGQREVPRKNASTVQRMEVEEGARIVHRGFRKVGDLRSGKAQVLCKVEFRQHRGLPLSKIRLLG
jgi:hypothetical protein